MPIYEFEGKSPSIGKGTYVHPEATIIGDVKIGEGCYIAPGARIRGDWGRIEIGPGSNVQENCIIHVYPGRSATMGPHSHIGHGAILHTPNLGEHVLIGMGAIVMDDVIIGDGCCIGAGALVKEKTEIPAFKLAVGVPAKIIGDVSDDMRRAFDEGTAHYQALPQRCFTGIREVKLEEVCES